MILFLRLKKGEDNGQNFREVSWKTSCIILRSEKNRNQRGLDQPIINSWLKTQARINKIFRKCARDLLMSFISICCIDLVYDWKTVLRDFAGRENGCQLTIFPLNMLQHAFASTTLTPRRIVHIIMTFESLSLECTPGGEDVLMWLL